LIALVEIQAARFRHIAGRGQIDNRLGALLHRDCKELHQSDRESHSAAGRVAEPSFDESRMQAIRGDACSRQPPRQDSSKQDVAQFRKAIYRERLVVVFGLQVVEIDFRAIVRVRRSVDHSRRPGRR